ncbi:maleylpyruvate isomerase family mycothiol-dependent enzyme [Rhodococcus antarcticus]|uniref:Maleylpyruvate isomerase family mycothiol-dependent enzyme n=1 Tax=Rhodococcus antarcticus TaxID=2987751 RepID=A0ABY6NZ72_9NOCA|nr:maleylpyruvate isomerase family mycothiol-dependent enzyme [Rhodococcus antarcticus]UZJ24283.1 maleylpyruvate isomerase family mycothiol-dependent enzyme [Rhodococcus antarcticus]
MTTTLTAPRAPTLPRPIAMRLAETEYDRTLTQLRTLQPADWTTATDCPAWDVHAVVSHVVGMAEMSASIPEQVRQMRAASKAGGEFIDALTALQVAKHAHDTPAQLVARFAVVGPRAAKGRRRTPSVVRHRTMPVPQHVGTTTEQWTLGYLVDIILTRDLWMHRVDIARATGRDVQLTAEHDGELVADIVTEWAGRHGRPCTLQLTGPAGGQWTFGTGGTDITEDAVTFCRGLSGRGEPAYDTAVPF